MEKIAAKVAATTQLHDSTTTLVNSIADRIDALRDSPGQLGVFAKELRRMAPELASAVAQNTHAAQPGVPLVNIAMNEAHGMVRPPEGTIGDPGDGAGVTPGSPNEPAAPIQPPYAPETVPDAGKPAPLAWSEKSDKPAIKEGEGLSARTPSGRPPRP